MTPHTAHRGRLFRKGPLRVVSLINAALPVRGCIGLYGVGFPKHVPVQADGVIA